MKKVFNFINIILLESKKLSDNLKYLNNERIRIKKILIEKIIDLKEAPVDLFVELNEDFLKKTRKNNASKEILEESD